MSTPLFEIDIYIVYFFISSFSQARASNEYNTDVTRGDVPHAPVIEIVVQKTIANAELELLEVLQVLHDVERVEDVETEALRFDQHVLHAFLQAVRRANVVVGVGDFEGVMLGVVQDLAWQVIEREDVGELLAWSTTVDVAVYNFFARQEKVAHLIFSKHDVDLTVAAQIVV